MFEKLFDAFLHADGIDHALALYAAQPGFDDRPLGRVDHHRNAGNIRLGGQQVEILDHGRLGIDQAFVHVDVDDLRAVCDLLAGDIERGVEIVFLDQLREAGGTGDIRPFADVHKQGIRTDIQRFQTAETAPHLDLRHRTRRVNGHVFDQHTGMIRRRAAATADQVDEPAFRKLPKDFLHFLGRLVVFAERIGQTRIRMAGHESARDAGQFLQIRTQLLGSQRTVQTNHQRLGMCDGIPECLRRLAGQGAAAGIGDRARDKDRQIDAFAIEILLDCENSRLGIQRVEHGLDQQKVGAAIDQSRNGFRIDIDEFFEIRIAESGIVDIGRNRGRTVGRPQHPGHKTRLVGRIDAELVGDAARNACALVIQFVNLRFHAVIGHRDGGGIEGVGFQNIDTGFQESAMDFLDHIRPGQGQQVVVALLREGMAGEPVAAIIGFFQLVSLNHRAHGAVDDKDSILKQTSQFFRAVRLTLLDKSGAGRSGTVGCFAKQVWHTRLHDVSPFGRTPRMWQIANERSARFRV